VPSTGAYTLAMSSYVQRRAAARGRARRTTASARLIRTRETIDDLLALELG
jgi:hypothetical protein